MKISTKLSLMLCLALCFNLLQTLNAGADERNNAVSIGASALFDYHGSIEYIEYEKRISRRIALYAAFEEIAYQYEDGSYVENGRGPGGEIGLRVYPFRQALKEWYFGAGFGGWSAKGSWKDDTGTPFETSGSFRSSFGSFSLQTGYKWFFGSHMFIDPRLQLGVLRGNGDSEAFGYGSGFVAVRAAIGMSW